MEDKFGNKINDTLENKSAEKKDFKEVKKTAGSFFKDLLDIRSDTDKKGTIEDVKGNISMKGHTAWILVFSILIASIGLNANSPAVVIGAMLISPLMGPILGVGLSIGINDIDTLKRSLSNLAVMIGLSLLTSFLFFSIPLFQEETSEILARTAPDVRDVFIALAGGLALIIALSRRSQQTNTIAGVAIATALMPPLCAAGYGLAVKFEYFIGAMFLFTINTIFIALATFVIVKFLRFPMVKYINSVKRKRIARFASFVAIIILGFSIYSFTQLVFEKGFSQNAKAFIQDLKVNDDVNFIDEEEADNLNYEKKTLTIFPYGGNHSKEDIEKWNKKFKTYLPEATLITKLGKDDSDLRKEIDNLSGLYVQNQKIISSRDESIREKEEKIKLLENELSKYYNNKIPLTQISKEAKINYDGLESLGYSNLIKTDFNTIDTLVSFNAKWFDSIPDKNRKNIQLKNWLKTRLKLDTLEFTTQ